VAIVAVMMAFAFDTDHEADTERCRERNQNVMCYFHDIRRYTIHGVRSVFQPLPVVIPYWRIKASRLRGRKLILRLSLPTVFSRRGFMTRNHSGGT